MPCSERPLFLLFFFVAGGRLCCRAVHVEAFSPLPFAEDGVAVEPRPRRSLRREREARELIALSKLVRDTRRLQRQVRDARRLQLLIALVAAVRRAGLVG